VTGVTTIAIREETRRRLLRVAADLQKERGERCDFDSVIAHLIDTYERQKVDVKAWRQFAEPIRGVDFDALYRELLQERRLDNDRRG
jgi:hypothetical protein